MKTLYVTLPKAKAKRIVDSHNVKLLNVAGTRGSKEPGVGVFVRRVLEEGIL